MKKIIYTRYSVECKDNNFVLYLCQHYEFKGETGYSYVEFVFTNYVVMHDFIDALVVNGVEMAR